MTYIIYILIDPMKVVGFLGDGSGTETLFGDLKWDAGTG